VKGYGTLHEIALYVGRPVTTIRNWGRRHEIPTLRVGNVLLYHAASARRLAETRQSRTSRGNRAS
jgi:hypothetical protein